MSGFQFPPPPPPPNQPKTQETQQHYNHYSDPNRAGYRGRGRGRGGGNGPRGGGSYNNDTRNHDHSLFQGHVTANPHFASPSGLNERGSNPHPFSRHQSRDTFNGRFPGRYHSNESSSRNSLSHAREDQPSPAEARTYQPRTIAGHKRKLEALRGPVAKSEARVSSVPSGCVLSVPSFGGPILPRTALAPVDSSSKRSIAQSTSSTNSSSFIPNHRNVGKTSNSIGLVPGNAEMDYSSDSEEVEDDDDADVDEEKMYAALGSRLIFEHNGTVFFLQSVADLVQWKEERKRNAPTRARYEWMMQTKRQVGQERLRLIEEAKRVLYPSDSSFLGQTLGVIQHPGASRMADAHHDQNDSQETQVSSSAGKLESGSELENMKRKLKLQQKEVEKLRRQVSRSQSRLDQFHGATNSDEPLNLSAPNAAAGDTMPSRIDSSPLPSHIEPLKHAAEEVGDPQPVHNIASIPDPGEDTDDGPPEELTSKPQGTPLNVSLGSCKQFTVTGRCKEGSACRFTHDPVFTREAAPTVSHLEQRQLPRAQKNGPAIDHPTSNGPRKSIYQRLVEQEQAGQDRLLLQVIKQLGQADFFATKTA